MPFLICRNRLKQLQKNSKRRNAIAGFIMFFKKNSEHRMIILERYINYSTNSMPKYLVYC